MRKTSVERKIITVKMLILVSCIIMGFLCLKIWNINFKKTETVANNKIYKVYVETGFDTSTYTFATSKVFPTKGYVLNTSLTTCTGGGTISQDKNIINAIFNSSDSCKLYFDAKKPILYGLAVNTILNIVGDADDTSTAVIEDTELAYDGTSDKNLRYVGYDSTNNNPNNYIDIGDTSSLWRIIGVFNNIDDGTGKKETRLKIMRAELLGEYSWDTSASNINLGNGVNQWGASGSYEGADLMRELNGDYLNPSLSSNTIWYNGNDNFSHDWYYKSNSLSLSAQALIGDAVWYTGAIDYDSISHNTANDYYLYERGNATGKICSSGQYCNDSVTRTATWVGKIALPYASDFAYSVGDTDRDRCLDISLHNWGKTTSGDDNNCKKYSWLILSTDNGEGADPVFLSPVSDSDEASNVMRLRIYDYYFFTKLASNKSKVFPTAFLKSNVEITGGTGAIDDPYIAALP